MFNKSNLKLVVCFIAGLATVLAFDPFSQAWLVFFSLALLFYFFQSAVSMKQAFLFGLSFGLGMFVGGVSWVYVSLSTYGGMPLWMGSIAVILFAAVLALFIAFVGAVQALLVPRPGAQRLLVIVPCWVIFEWLKGWVLTGFPWLELGYSQTATWLFALAPIGGVYLISLLIVIISSLLVCVLVTKNRWLPLLTIAVIFVLMQPLSRVQWSDSIGKPLNIGLVQANVPIESKWQVGFRDRYINQYVSLSQQMHQQAPIDLFVWPETALPLYLQQTDESFWQSVVPPNSAVLTGMMDSLGEGEIYNAAVLSCAGQQHVYRKRHLVPFGEYLPLRFLFGWVLDYLQLPMSDFSSWKGAQPLVCPGNINLGLSICYEDAFGSEWRKNMLDATLLVNISEDAWFGDSLAPHQRLQMAQMRAREFSRPLLRSANTGPSVVIDHYGEVVGATEQFTEATLSYIVQPQTGDTWYYRFGNWVIILSFVFIALVTAKLRRVKVQT